MLQPNFELLWEQIKEKIKSQRPFAERKARISRPSLESFSREYYNAKNKFLGFHFEHVCTKRARPNYSVASPLRIQHDRLSTQEWCNCGKCEKMPTNLECVRCHEIPTFKAFHSNFKARLSWNTAVLELFAVEFNCEGNCFLEEFFSEICWESFLSLLSFDVLKMTPFQVFRSYFEKVVRFPKQLFLRTTLDSRHSI